MNIRIITWSVLASLAMTTFVTASVQAASITFPVLGDSTYTNDYDAPRANGRHGATDIIAEKGQPIVSATDGVIDYVTYPEPSWGYAVIVRSTAGNYFWYLHMNNDNPGTDDGKGGEMQAFAPDIEVGNPVKRGQLLGWVGDSGNSEGTVSHLHFEVHDDSRYGPTINFYNRLKNDSSKISKPINHPQLPSEILPYGRGYKRKVNVARADVTGDGVEDLITGAEGEGSSAKVHVYNPTTKTRLGNFYSLSKRLTDGVDVAAGDIDGDGVNEVITAVKASKNVKIGIYRYDRKVSNRFKKVREFVAYAGASSGRTIPRVATGDINNDGKDEIITGTGAGASSLIRAFTGTGEVVKSFRPIARSFTGGVDVTAGDIERQTKEDEIVAAPLTKGSSRTMIFDTRQTGIGVDRIRQFHAYGSKYRGGIRLSIGELDRRNEGFEIITAPNSGSRSVYRAKSSTGQTLQADTVLEDWWLGHYDIAASRDGSYEYSFATGGNRRGSVR